MKRKRTGAGTAKGSISSIRASISFPPKLYQTLEDIAKEKKVSVAWVVRDAAEKYVATEESDGRGGRLPGSAQRAVR